MINTVFYKLLFIVMQFGLLLDDKREVGRYNPRKSKLFGSTKSAHLELVNDDEQIIEDIGEIVLTLTYMLHESGKNAHIHV